MFESLGVINVWTYLVGLFFIIIAPGPNSLYVLRTGAVRGIGPGYRAALGVFVGDAILIFCAYLGIASLIRTTPLLPTSLPGAKGRSLRWSWGSAISPRPSP